MEAFALNAKMIKVTKHQAMLSIMRYINELHLHY